MANGDLYTVGSELQNILTRRKAEARQAMLDQLAQEKFEQEKLESDAQIEATLENTKSNRIWREGQAKIDAANAEARQLAGLDSMGIDPETVLPSGRLGDDQLALAKKTGRVASDTTPVSENIGDGFGEKLIWQGNAAQRKDLNQKKQRESFIQELMNNPDTDKDMINRLRIAATFGGDLSAADLRAIAGGDAGSDPTSVKEYRFAQSQGYKGSYEQYQKEDANRRNPAPPREHNLQLKEVIDPVTNKPALVWFDPRNPTAPPIPVGGGYGPKPTGGITVAKPPFEQGAITIINRLRADFDKLFQRDPELSRQATIAARNNYVQTSISHVSNSPNIPDPVKQAVISIMQRAMTDNPDQRSTQEILQAAQKAKAFDPHSMAIFANVLGTVRGQ